MLALNSMALKRRVLTMKTGDNPLPIFVAADFVLKNDHDPRLTQECVRLIVHPRTGRNEFVARLELEQLYDAGWRG